MEPSPSQLAVTAPTELDTLFEIKQGAVQYEGCEKWVPEAVDLSVSPGQIIALLGPSGCGKSSISLTTNGLVPHSVPSVYRGSATVCGTEVAVGTIAEFATVVAMVQQDPDAQIVTTRVDQEVWFALENLCLPVEEIQSRTAQALEQVGLADYASQDPWELSGGQRQRLALACALAMKPQLLVLDEVTANIDPANAEEIYRLVAAQAKRGMGVLLIEHELDRILEHVDEVVAIDKNGQQIGRGEPREIFYGLFDELQNAGIWTPTPLRLAKAFPQLAARQPLTFDEALAALKEANLTGDDLLTFAKETSHRAGHKSEQPGLSIRCLDGGYRKVEVLHQVSFDAPAGAITAIIGANGSGKSTLMSSIAGLNHHVSAESFAVGDKPLKAGRPHRKIGYVFQNPTHQFIRSTVHDELAHSFQVSQKPPEEIEKQVNRLLKDFDLEEYAQSSPYQLSGGQQRRLSVATTMGEDRQVICLDEPTFGQDQRSTEQLNILMRRLADLGQAVILATHDMNLVSEHADHVVLIDGGKVVAEGTSEEVFTNEAALATGLQPPMIYRLATALDRGPVQRVLPKTVKPISRPKSASEQFFSHFDLRRHLGPLTSFLAIIPITIAVLIVAKPFLGFITMILATFGIVFFSGRGLRYTLGLSAGIWAFAVIMVIGTSFSYIPEYHGIGHPVSVGPITLDSVQLELSLAMGARIGGMLTLLIFSGATSDPKELVKALSKYFHLPVRITYAGVASISFAHRFTVEHQIIMTARKLRRTAGKAAIIAPITRWVGSIVPLMVNAVRHAENVSMAMDARAFGAHRKRTVIDEVRWSWMDTVFWLGAWAITAGLIWFLQSHDLIGGFYYGRY